MVGPRSLRPTARPSVPVCSILAGWPTAPDGSDGVVGAVGVVAAGVGDVPGAPFGTPDFAFPCGAYTGGVRPRDATPPRGGTVVVCPPCDGACASVGTFWS